METWISARLSISGSGRVSVSRRVSTSRIAAELRPPRVRDLRTMEGSVLRVSLRVSDQYIPGRPLRSRLALQVAATYVTWRCGSMISLEIRNTLLTRLQIRRKLSLCINGKFATFMASKVRCKFYVQTWENWPKMESTPSRTKVAIWD